MPFIVIDNDKLLLSQGLKKYKEDKVLLVNTIKHEQDLYEMVSKDLLNFNLDIP